MHVCMYMCMYVCMYVVSEWWFNAVSATKAIFTARTCVFACVCLAVPGCLPRPHLGWLVACILVGLFYLVICMFVLSGYLFVCMIVPGCLPLPRLGWLVACILVGLFYLVVCMFVLSGYLFVCMIVPVYLLHPRLAPWPVL